MLTQFPQALMLLARRNMTSFCFSDKLVTGKIQWVWTLCFYDFPLFEVEVLVLCVAVP